MTNRVLNKMIQIGKTYCHNTIQLTCRLGTLFVLLGMCLMILGCSKRYSDMPAYWPVPFREYKNQSAGRFKSTYLVEQMDAYYRGASPGPIGVTTLVNLDDLNSSSSFGRMYSEQIMSELSMLGYDVVELRHADALHFLSNTGEFALSRDVGAVRPVRDLGGIVVGTYSISPKRVYINARLIDPSTSIILTAGSVEMDKTPEIARMVRGGALPATLERIPVRHLGSSTYPLLSPGRRYDLEESSGGSWTVPPPAPALKEGWSKGAAAPESKSEHEKSGHSDANPADQGS